MGPAPVLFLGSQSPTMLLLVSVYPVNLFDLIDVPLSSFRVFLLQCVPFVVLALVFLPGLYSAACRTVFLA